MRIAIVAVGRFGAGRKRPEAALYDHFAGRIRPPPVLREIAEARGRGAAERKRREGQALLKAIPPGAVAVALDAAGDPVDSPAFAAWLAAQEDAGVDALCFLIGGADGHDGAVLAAARRRLSLGTMTWPHLLVRSMLAEQIYRAQTIRAGHPYHRA